MTSAVLAGAGIVASARGDDDVALVLFALLAGASLAPLVVLHPRRRAVTVRSDLADWLERTACVTGEPVDEVVDRSISAYRAHVSEPGP
jgi:hypothetical protein